MYIGEQYFNDAHLHACSIGNWQQTYDQISPGRFHSRIIRLDLEGLSIFRESFNQRLAQHGTTPAERIHFAIPLSALKDSALQGCKPSTPVIMVLNGQQNFTFHCDAHLDYIQLSVSQQDISHAIPRLFQAIVDKKQPPFIPITASGLNQASQNAHRLLQQTLQQSDMLYFDGVRRLIKQQFIELLLDALQEAEPQPRRNLTYTTYNDIVQRTQAIVLKIPDEPATVLDVCRQLRISRRTLQTSFQRITQASPITYLRSVRLNRVRRMLLQSDTCNIREAAGYWGFYHLGHFCNEYRLLFNELPSDTLKRGKQV